MQAHTQFARSRRADRGLPVTEDPWLWRQKSARRRLVASSAANAANLKAGGSHLDVADKYAPMAQVIS